MDERTHYFGDDCPGGHQAGDIDEAELLPCGCPKQIVDNEGHQEDCADPYARRFDVSEPMVLTLTRLEARQLLGSLEREERRSRRAGFPAPRSPVMQRLIDMLGGENWREL